MKRSANKSKKKKKGEKEHIDIKSAKGHWNLMELSTKTTKITGMILITTIQISKNTSKQQL